MAWRTIASDLDQTLTADDSRTLTREAAALLDGFLQRRMPVLIATARGLHGDRKQQGARLSECVDVLGQYWNSLGLDEVERSRRLERLYLAPENGCYLVGAGAGASEHHFGFPSVGDDRPLLDEIQSLLAAHALESDQHLGAKRYTVTLRGLGGVTESLRQEVQEAVRRQARPYRVETSRGSVEICPAAAGKGFIFNSWLRQVRADLPDLDLRGEQVLTLGDKGGPHGVDHGMLNRLGGISVDEYDADSPMVPARQLFGRSAFSCLQAVIETLRFVA